MSIFWREIRLVLDIGASDEWYGDYWIVSCCSHCTLWHSHLVGCFDIEIWLPVCDYCFSMDYGALDTSGLVFSTYLDDLGYIPFISYSVISPWILSCFLFYQSLIITFFYLTHPTVTHDLTPFSIRRRCRSVLDHLGCAFIYLLDFRFNIFHDGRAWQIVDLLVTMFSLWQLACWVLICLFFRILSTGHHCFYSSVIYI